jgi:lysophospholipase L1-like esterase
MSRYMCKTTLNLFASCLVLLAMGASTNAQQQPGDPGASTAAPASESAKPRATVGVYYFDGWAGKSERWQDDPAWIGLHPPTHLTKRLIEEFGDREPIWGWRDDSLEIMERQIDLAADHGIAFFAFCWYWNKDPAKLAQDPKHTCLDLFLKARNHGRLKFCLLVANHQGHLFQDADEWAKAAEGWLPYFKHPQHLTVDGKPLVIVFNPGNGTREGLAQVQATATKAGLPGVAIAGCGGDPKAGYTHTTHYNIVPGYAAGSEAHKFAELVEAHSRAWRGTREQPYMPVLSVGWDKRPWEGDRGLGQKPGWYFTDRTPEQLAAGLESAIAWMDQHPDQTTAERIVLLYAWNELGEGGYLAPTKGDPEGAYLRAVKQVVRSAGPTDRSVQRILFLGNSITRHGPSAKVGWTGNWGMAASAQDKDYVHVLTDALAQRTGVRQDVRIDNIADFEKHYDTCDLDALLGKHLDFKPDVIVVAIGENVPTPSSEEAQAAFKARFVRLLTVLKQNGQPALFVRSCFWPNQVKDDLLRESCTAAGGVFVNIGGLSKDESNYARSERAFAHAGVAAHPGDKGMQAIADALLAAMKSQLPKEPDGKERTPTP